MVRTQRGRNKLQFGNTDLDSLEQELIIACDLDIVEHVVHAVLVC